jgi:feruloyl esterase
MGDCSALCNSFSPSNWAINNIQCVQLSANNAYDTPTGQANAQCGTSFTPEVDICKVSMNVQTSGVSSTYMEVWLPQGDNYNGRTMSTDNGHTSLVLVSLPLATTPATTALHSMVLGC